MVGLAQIQLINKSIVPDTISLPKKMICDGLCVMYIRERKQILKASDLFGATEKHVFYTTVSSPALCFTVG